MVVIVDNLNPHILVSTEFSKKALIILVSNFDKNIEIVDTMLENVSRITTYAVNSEFFDGFYKLDLEEGEYLTVEEFTFIRFIGSDEILIQEGVSEDMLTNLDEVSLEEVIKRAKVKKCKFSANSGEILDYCQILEERGLKKIDGNFTKKWIYAFLGIFIFILLSTATKKVYINEKNKTLQDLNNQILQIKREIKKFKDRYYVALPKNEIPLKKLEILERMPFKEINSVNILNGKVYLNGKVFYFNLKDIKDVCKKHKMRCNIKYSSLKGEIYDVNISF